MQKITPCLWFDGKAEEAANYYVSLLPDSRIDKIFRSSANTECGSTGAVMFVEFTLYGTRFTALNAGPMFKFNEAVSFQIPCKHQEEVDRLWEGLSADGEPGHCGWLKDRWGLSWQVIPTRLFELLDPSSPERYQKVMQAMMQMNKLDIAGLERAAREA